MPTNFTATARGYHPHNAHVLALLSASTYADGPPTPAGFNLVRPPIECAGTTVHVLSSPDAAFVAFRGTDERRDWLLTDTWTDLESLTDFPFDYRRVHRGFRNALNAVATQIEDELSFGDRLKDGISTATTFLNTPGVDIEKFHHISTYTGALSTYTDPV